MKITRMPPDDYNKMMTMTREKRSELPFRQSGRQGILWPTTDEGEASDEESSDQGIKGGQTTATEHLMWKPIGWSAEITQEQIKASGA